MELSPQTLGQVPYLPTVEAMQAFTASRAVDTPDQLWICEHPSVYTQGLAGKTEHIFNPGAIPVVQTNRGGAKINGHEYVYHPAKDALIRKDWTKKMRGLKWDEFVKLVQASEE